MENTENTEVVKTQEKEYVIIVPGIVMNCNDAITELEYNGFMYNKEIKLLHKKEITSDEKNQLIKDLELPEDHFIKKENNRLKFENIIKETLTDIKNAFEKYPKNAINIKLTGPRFYLVLISTKKDIVDGERIFFKYAPYKSGFGIKGNIEGLERFLLNQFKNANDIRVSVLSKESLKSVTKKQYKYYLNSTSNDLKKLSLGTGAGSGRISSWVDKRNVGIVIDETIELDIDKYDKLIYPNPEHKIA